MTSRGHMIFVHVNQSVTLDCRFRAPRFSLFDNPVVWTDRACRTSTQCPGVLIPSKVYVPLVDTFRKRLSHAVMSLAAWYSEMRRHFCKTETAYEMVSMRLRRRQDENSRTTTRRSAATTNVSEMAILSSVVVLLVLQRCSIAFDRFYVPLDTQAMSYWRSSVLARFKLETAVVRVYSRRDRACETKDS